jgi:acyl-coenzyme A synthetase/AMP-(fatty) acid ligase
MAQLPLLADLNHGKWIVNDRGGLTQPEFLYRVHRLADRLPEHQYAIMLPRGGEEFLIGFCAALVRGQTALLPVNDSDIAIAELAVRYPDCYVMVDVPRPTSITTMNISSVLVENGTTEDIPILDSSHVVAILQTSGSSGESQPHEKTWGAMVAGVDRWRNRLAINALHYIVTTVPRQHMYGFETSVLLPLQVGTAFFAGCPFYPADVAAALRLGTSQAMLITTPFHLRICGQSDLDWSSLRSVVSSTGNLDPRIAGICETRMHTSVMEIFGSTETGAIASRRPSAEKFWLCLDGLQLDTHGGVTSIRDTVTGGSTPITDEIQVIDGKTFELCGRPADMLKVAGKTGSVADLNLRLNRIVGVEDGVFVRQHDRDRDVERLIVLAVAPKLDAHQIRTELSSQVDSVFLPRRIYFIDKLPRNETGKISKQAMERLIAQLTNR